MSEYNKLLSLSALSFVGPWADVDDLMHKGFYKKNKGNVEFLKDIDVHEGVFAGYGKSFHDFLEDFGIDNKGNFIAKVMELINGSYFSRNMEKLLQFGKFGSVGSQFGRVVVNGRSYPVELMNELLKYEFHWPDNSLMAYDLANCIMLLRLGVSLGYINERAQIEYFEQILFKVKSEFTGFKDFGEQAAIGRSIHFLYLDKVRGKKTTIQGEGAYAVAYHSLWSHFDENEIFTATST